MLDVKAGVMIDIETMSHRKNASIVSIGAVFFNDKIEVVDKFYQVVDLRSCEKVGLDISASTVLWWLNKPHIARGEFVGQNEQLETVLDLFSIWIGRIDGKDIQGIWANSPSFDLVVLKNAYSAICMRPPWRYYDEFDYRTLKNLHPEIELEDVGIAHNALDDCIKQVQHLKKIVELYK